MQLKPIDLDSLRLFIKSGAVGDLTKDAAIEVHRMHFGFVGDTARTSKSRYVDVLTTVQSNDPQGRTKLFGYAAALLGQPSPKDEEPTKHEPKEPVPTKPAQTSAVSGDVLNALVTTLMGAAGQSFMTEAQVKALVEKRVKEIDLPTRTVVVREGKPTKEIPGFKHPAFERVLQLVGQRKHVLLVGPAGCGKTYLAHQVAEAMGLTFSSNSCTAGMSESHVTGWLLPVNGQSFEYVGTPFVARYEEGGLHLLDEVDAADPNMLLIINQALANGGIHIPQRYKQPYVKRHKDFVCIAAANTYGTGANAVYVGRERLDAAFLDRFRIGVVEMDYDTSFEKANTNTKVLEWAYKVREKINSLKLKRVMSTRFLLDATQMIDAGWTLDDCKRSYFADWTADERQKVGG